MDKLPKEYGESALLHVLELLRSEKSRRARRTIYHAYIDYKFNNKPKAFDEQEIRNSADMLKGDLDEIGFLIEFDYVDKIPFLSLYSDTVRRVWISLSGEIELERKLRDSPDSERTDVFLEYFEKLAIAAKHFRDQKGLPEPLFTDYRTLHTHACP